MKKIQLKKHHDPHENEEFFELITEDGIEGLQTQYFTKPELEVLAREILGKNGLGGITTRTNLSKT